MKSVIYSRIFGINLKPGVISGVGKGIIGTRQECEPLLNSGLRAFSLLVWPSPENFGSKGYGNQNRSLSQYRRRYGWVSHVKEAEAELLGTMSPREHGECFVLKGNSLRLI